MLRIRTYVLLQAELEMLHITMRSATAFGERSLSRLTDPSSIGAWTKRAFLPYQHAADRDDGLFKENTEDVLSQGNVQTLY